jgi:hypothetical protein
MADSFLFTLSGLQQTGLDFLESWGRLARSDNSSLSEPETSESETDLTTDIRCGSCSVLILHSSVQKNSQHLSLNFEILAIANNKFSRTNLLASQLAVELVRLAGLSATRISRLADFTSVQVT